MMEKEQKRLQKAIAEAGLASRRKAEIMISEGLVKVNGEIVRTLGTLVNQTDKIEIAGQIIENEQTLAFLFNKPIRVLTTASDDRGRITVVDFFKEVPSRLYPVGRLDYLTSGALVVTNNGELANLMTHPSSHLKKVYLATLDKEFVPELTSRLEGGIELEDGMTAPAQVKIISDVLVEITIHEGRNRQVRRMFESLGYEVQKLHRKSIGFLEITKLKPGQFRVLDEKEIADIKEICIGNKKNNIIPSYKKKLPLNNEN